jgi:arginase
MRDVRIVAAASGRGAADPGCAGGPEALRRSDLLTRLWRGGLDPIWDATIPAPDIADASTAVRSLCQALSQRVRMLASRGAFPLVLGGDHSCAIGTWSGIASALGARGPLGLIWIDAHMDAHIPGTSPSGAFHGMPLACLLGEGDPDLVAVAGGCVLSARNVCLVGVRSFESDEAVLLSKLGVRVITMDEIAKRGLEDVMHEAHAIATDGTAAFGITIDVDAIDPDEAPGVGHAVSGGSEQHARRSRGCARFRTIAKLVAAEITEYNPSATIRRSHARVVSSLAAAVLGAERVQSKPPRAQSSSFNTARTTTIRCLSPSFAVRACICGTTKGAAIWT